MDKEVMDKIQKLSNELDILFNEYFLSNKDCKVLKKIQAKQGELYNINK